MGFPAQKDVGAARLGPCWGGLGMAFPAPVVPGALGSLSLSSLSLALTLTKNNALCRLVSPLLEESEKLIRNALPSSLLALEGFHYHAQPG